MSRPLTRIGMLTGGGDAPGLNAVIRAVVKAAVHRRHRVHRPRGQLRRPHRPGTLPRADAEGRHRHPPHRRHHPRHHEPRQSLRLSRSRPPTARSTTPTACVEKFHKMKLDALVVIGGDGTLTIAREFFKRGIPDRRRAEDHRQRHRRDDDDVRVRHGGGVRDRSDRPAAHHGGGAPPDHGRRGHGPLRRVDRALRRRRRRRRRRC